MKRTSQTCTGRLLIAASHEYLIFLGVWLGATLLVGDRFVYLGLLNLLTVYLFLPLPIVLLAAILLRRRELWLGFGAGLLIFLWFWGALFAPWRWSGGRRAQAGGSTLTVMSYNVLARHSFTDPIMDTIRAEDADVVFLQEVNHGLAQVLQNELGELYPHQLHVPEDDPRGIGVISKYPFRPNDDQLPHYWIGGPLLLDLQWNGQNVRLVNFHMLATPGLAPREILAAQFRVREEQAQLLVDYARQGGPAILAGDANATPFNDAYRILAGELNDAWEEAGFGLGHTFPGSDLPGSSRPRIGPWYVPRWLARVDYIFYSNHWQAVSARMAQVDGISDHRGVVATLRLRDPGTP